MLSDRQLALLQVVAVAAASALAAVAEPSEVVDQIGRRAVVQEALRSSVEAAFVAAVEVQRSFGRVLVRHRKDSRLVAVVVAEVKLLLAEASSAPAFAEVCQHRLLSSTP